MRWVWAISALILTACSSSLQVQNLPVKTVESELFALEQTSPKNEKSLLTVQYSTNVWRWVQTDPLGAPIARLQLSKNGWQNDGFVMPNPQAKQLFSAVATYLNPNSPPFVFSQIEQTAQAKGYFINGKLAWKIAPNGERATIELSDHSHWILQRIE